MCWRPTRTRPNRPRGARRRRGPQPGAGWPQPPTSAVKKGGRRRRPATAGPPWTQLLGLAGRWLAGRRGRRRRQSLFVATGEHSFAGRRQLLERQRGLWRRRRAWRSGRSLNELDPVGKLLAAAIVAWWLGLVLAIGAALGAGDPNVEMIVVAPDRAHLMQPGAILVVGGCLA